MKKVAIGCDHAGFPIKALCLQVLKSKGIEVLDFGTDSKDSVDYPDYIHPLAQAVQAKEVDAAVIICGSGNGVAMTANKYQNVRAAVCWHDDLAALARLHNDANVIAIPARFVSESLAAKMLETFIDTAFEGGRHQRRVDKIACATIIKS